MSEHVTIRVPAGTRFRDVNAHMRYGKLYAEQVVRATHVPAENAYHFDAEGQRYSVPAPVCTVVPPDESEGGDAETKASDEAEHAKGCPMGTPLYVERGYDLYGKATRCTCGAVAEEKPVSIIPPKGVKRFDPVSRITWLEFDGKPDDITISLLKRDGWRWSGYRKQWHTNRRFARVPEGIPFDDEGECDYASERSDRLEARSDKHEAKGLAARASADRIASMIPMGQPILVGHHSERRARRDQERITSGMRKWVAESDTAGRLDQRAVSSRRHQAAKQKPAAMQRRKDRLEAEHRKRLRVLTGHETDPAYAGYREDTAAVGREIAELAEAIAAAGGILADTLVVAKGDIVDLGGSEVRIDRVNPKTFSGTIVSGGAKGFKMKWDRTDLRRVIRKASETQPTPEGEAEATV